MSFMRKYKSLYPVLTILIYSFLSWCFEDYVASDVALIGIKFIMGFMSGLLAWKLVNLFAYFWNKNN